MFALQMLINALVVSLGASFTAIISHIIVAYACARFKFRFAKVLYGTAIIVMIVPIVGSLPSAIRIMNMLNLKNTILGYFFMRGSYTGLYFLIFFATFKSIPYTYTEAAKIDGASNLKIMIRVIVPMARATMRSSISALSYLSLRPSTGAYVLVKF